MEKLGVPAVNGLKMLLYQGILAYELWNDLTVSETLTDKVYLALQDAIYGKKRGDNIVLIGYMGAGKTTVGKALAKKLGYEFIDTDLYIEAQEGMTIPDFGDGCHPETSGEDTLRDRDGRWTAASQGEQ